MEGVLPWIGTTKLTGNDKRQISVSLFHSSQPCSSSLARETYAIKRKSDVRHSADDVTMSGKVEWWAEEVALEHVVLAAEERERLSRRRS